MPGYLNLISGCDEDKTRPMNSWHGYQRSSSLSAEFGAVDPYQPLTSNDERTQRKRAGSAQCMHVGAARCICFFFDEEWYHIGWPYIRMPSATFDLAITKRRLEPVERVSHQAEDGPLTGEALTQIPVGLAGVKRRQTCDLICSPRTLLQG